MRRKFVEMQISMKTYQDSISNLTSEVDALKNENLKLNTDIKVIRNEHQEMSHSIYFLENKNKELVSENAGLRE